MGITDLAHKKVGRTGTQEQQEENDMRMYLGV
jgi:hypothetical protein